MTAFSPELRTQKNINLPFLDLSLYDDPPSAVILLSMIMESPYSLCLKASEPLLRSWTETWPDL